VEKKEIYRDVRFFHGALQLSAVLFLHYVTVMSIQVLAQHTSILCPVFCLQWKCFPGCL